MPRMVGRYVAPEMAVLWLVELVVASAVVYGVLCVTIGAIGGVIGLYRPEICLDRRRLLLHAAMVAVLALPVGLLVGRAVAADLTRAYVLWYAHGLAIWVVCVLLTRSVLHHELL